MSKPKGFKTEEKGQPNTTTYKLYFKSDQNNEYISPFHDIPLHHDKDNNIFNAVIEIPRWSNAKMEINKKEKLNPIKQDVKNNKLRYVSNVFPYHGYITNYGALPQTWEDPSKKDEASGLGGDNDPLDVCEIGSRIHRCGSVVKIKVLGALGLIDEGETDWKIIAIDVSDPLASKLNDVNDVEVNMPGFLGSIRDWFAVYKIPTGKPKNSFVAEGKFYDREFALGLIKHNHESWNSLLMGKLEASSDAVKEISLFNTTLEIKPALKLTSSETKRVVAQSSQVFNSKPAVVDRIPINQVHFVDRSKI